MHRRRLAIGLAALTLPVFMTSALGARAPQAATQPSSIQERLARVRTEVFTRPDRGNASVKELHELLALEPQLAEAHLLLGLVHVSRGTSQMRAEAVAEFRQALEIAPDLVPARFYLARVYMELGQLERAREELTTLTTNAPKSAQFVGTLGEVERRLGNPTRAAELTRQAVSIEAGAFEARYYLGLALADLGRRDEAIAELEAVAKANVNVQDVHASLGVLYLQANRVDDAIEAFTIGSKLAKPRPEVHIYLARGYRLKGLLAQADAELDRALPPGASMEASGYYQRLEGDILFERGLIRLAQKRTAAARQSFDEALKMNPTPEMKQAIDAALAPSARGGQR